MLVAHRARTSIVLGAAGATVVAALLLTQQRPTGRTDASSAALTDDMLRADFATTKLLPGSHDENVVITITAPTGSRAKRPPLSVAIVIDRSGSMTGAPMENAKRAASRLVGSLSPDDAFTVITYSSGDQVVMPMSRATDANKSAARSAIERIYDDGGTCISCGISRGADELSKTPIRDGVRRIVLISDGQANEGIRDRDELAQWASTIVARGTSLTSVGVGLDFDELTMQRLASVGRGNYYFIEDTANLDAMFAKELGGLAETVVTDARLVLGESLSAEVAEAYGYQIAREGNRVTIPIADMTGGETRKVVLRVRVTSPTVGGQSVFPVRLDYRNVVTSRPGAANASAVATIVNDAHAVEASVVPLAAQAVEEVLSSRALEEAATAYEQHGYGAAKQVLDVRMNEMSKNVHLRPATRAKLEAAGNAAADNFRSAAPAKAMKASRKAAYDLAH